QRDCIERECVCLNAPQDDPERAVQYPPRLPALPRPPQRPPYPAPLYATCDCFLSSLARDCCMTRIARSIAACGLFNMRPCPTASWDGSSASSLRALSRANPLCQVASAGSGKSNLNVPETATPPSVWK